MLGIACGAYASACPSRDEAVSHLALAVSPEVERRLQVRFPPGTPEATLVEQLQRDGFKGLGQCDTDSTIRSLSYSQGGGSLLWFPLDATISWKVDDSNRVAWTHGFVFYESL